MDDKCNCNEEFRTNLCPVHDKTATQAYQKKKILITDANMTPEQIISWTGHGFVCPECNYQLLHNFKFCAGCGAELLIHSKIVTDYFNTISQKNKGQLNVKS